MDALTFHRIGAWAMRHRVPLLPRVCEGIIFTVFSAVIPNEASIGEGTLLGYRGLGIVIHRRAVIGEDCVLSPHVVIGGRSGYSDLPVIGNRVFVGAGAKMLGPITVGDDAVIGANAVVIGNVPGGSVAAGVPARIMHAVAVDRDAAMSVAKDEM